MLVSASWKMRNTAVARPRSSWSSPTVGVHAHGMLVRRVELLGLPLDRGAQAERVEDAGAQLGRDPAHRWMISSVAARHLGELRASTPSRCSSDAARDPGDVQLERGQRLAELVVDLARDVRALVLARGLDALGQRAQLIVELPALDRDARDVGCALDQLAVRPASGCADSR